jgi:hypothetical protein
VLKEELGFQGMSNHPPLHAWDSLISIVQGFIVSDWAAMINGVQPALAGLDMNMPGFLGYVRV